MFEGVVVNGNFIRTRTATKAIKPAENTSLAIITLVC